MRLLSEDGCGGYTLTRFSEAESVPAYAILSHTWLSVKRSRDGADLLSEPTFQELQQGKGQHEQSHDKIYFCSKQAKKDGFNTFGKILAVLMENTRASSRTQSAPRSRSGFAGVHKEHTAMCFGKMSQSAGSTAKNRWFFRV